jgi:2-oxoglutarate ferredoxin oxidoreductase subunit delta
LFDQNEREDLIDAIGPFQQEAADLVKIIVDYAKCLEDPDKICVEICPFSVFASKNDEKPKVVKEEDCIMCRSCQVNCPGQAISILP